MEIPQEVQDKLKCSECDEFLSCGPVYLLHETGGTICGRCSQQLPENDPHEISDKTRNESYEAAASLLGFPCAHAAQGCQKKVPFSLGRPAHESNCRFRLFFCPIVTRGSCDWIGSWTKLKQHCEEKHPENILDNPGNLPRPDLSVSNLQTYVIAAFRFLFLLHIKVCLTSGKLFHSLRLFGNPELLDKFSYSLIIQENDSKTVKRGLVRPSGKMMLQESAAYCILINGLLSILDGKYDESKFTFAIETSLTFNCINCLHNIGDVFDSKICNSCQGKLDKCKFNDKGCLFVNFNYYKCEKHENFFCKYQTKCFLSNCRANLVAGSFIKHLGSSTTHKTTEANINSFARITHTCVYPFLIKKYILFSSNIIETIICEYKLSGTNLNIYLFTSLLSYELKNYECSIELTDPRTKHTQIITPQIEYNKMFDWSIDKEMNDFPSCTDIGINLRINFKKS